LPRAYEGVKMIENILEKVAANHDFSIEDDLLQNLSNPMSLHDAHNIEPAVALRWRFRICKISGRTFDITEEGLFYTCGEYVVV